MSHTNSGGFTKFDLMNADGRIATYECADLACAQMLAAEDVGGEPEEWREINECGDWKFVSTKGTREFSGRWDDAVATARAGETVAKLA